MSYPPQCFQSRSKIFLMNEKSVHDKAWTVRIQVGPTSECFRQRSVHEDDWKFYKQCSTVIGRVVLSQSRGRRLKTFSQTYYCRSAHSTIGQSNNWIVRFLSIYLFIYLSIYLPICLSIYPSIYLSINLLHINLQLGYYAQVQVSILVCPVVNNIK